MFDLVTLVAVGVSLVSVAGAVAYLSRLMIYRPKPSSMLITRGLDQIQVSATNLQPDDVEKILGLIKDSDAKRE